MQTSMHAHTYTASGPIHTTHTHTPNRPRGCRRQGLHMRRHTQTCLLSLCITNTNELIDVQRRQRNRQSFPQSEVRRERKINCSECECVFVSRVLFYFLSASQHLGFQRLRQCSGAQLAKLRPSGPAGTPAVRLGSVQLDREKHSNERNY